MKSSTLEKSSLSSGNLEQRFQNLILLSKLESLNLPFHTVESIEETDKMSLIEAIFRSCGHLAAGLSLVVDLCLQFQMLKPLFWSKVLSRLLKLGEKETLKKTLLALNKTPSLWHCPEFQQGMLVIFYGQK